MINAKWLMAAVLLAAAPGAVSQETRAARKIPAELEHDFARLHALIRPLPGEYAWREEPRWQGRLQAARELAAREDKPILFVCAANSYPLGRT